MDQKSSPVAKDSSQEAVVLFSGGIDSTACVHFLRTQGMKVAGLFIDYSQAALGREKQAVRSISELLSFDVHEIRIDGLDHSGSGEQAGRNALLLSIALFWARGKCPVIATGIHSGSGYYDCSPQFLEAMASLFSDQTDGKASLISPFESWSKQDIYDYATGEKLPLSFTYSCESGTVPTCGRCASCRDRKVLGC